MFHFENEWFQLATLRLHFTDKHASHLPIRFRKLKSQFSVWNQNKNIRIMEDGNCRLTSESAKSIKIKGILLKDVTFDGCSFADMTFIAVSGVASSEILVRLKGGTFFGVDFLLHIWEI